MKIALITGITGQDGAYLAEFLLKKGYVVHGIKRRTSLFNTDRIDHLYQDPHVDNRRFILHYGDMTDSSSLIRIVQEVQPDEIYNLAAHKAMSRCRSRSRSTRRIPTPWGRCVCSRRSGSSAWRRRPASTRPRPPNCTDWCRKCPRGRRRHFIRARPMPWQSSTPTGSRSITARPMASMPATESCSIMKARSGARPSSRARSRARWRASSLSLLDCLYLGNLDARRDWGHARDYVEAQWLMLQQKSAEDFVIASGVQYSVRDFVDAAASELGMRITWKGQGVEEKGYDAAGRCIVAVDPRYFRPTEVETLLGDPSKARDKLGWTPRTSFKELVAEMVREDLKVAERDELVKKHGYKTMDYHE
jgi:GDPmannose 4,6-dehydratase